MRITFHGPLPLLLLWACSGLPSRDNGTSSPEQTTPADAGTVADAGPTVDCSTRSADAPAVRSELGGILDEARQRLVFFGGNTAVATACNVPPAALTGETWVFHLDCNSWELLQPINAPFARARFGTAHDTQRNRLLIFGGREKPSSSYVNLNEVWAFDLSTDTWSQLDASGDAPPERSSPVSVYDPERDRLVIFGGNSSTSGLSFTSMNDLYSLDLGSLAWSRVDAANGPAARLYHSAVVLGGEMVVFGGTPTYGGPYYNDTYAFNLTNDTWRSVSESGADRRFGGEIFADSVRNRILLFGGHDDGALGMRNDVWALSLLDNTWANLNEGDTLNGSASGQCDFPADFTLPEAGAPERRYAFARVQSAEAGFIFAGKTDCGAVNDVFKLTLENAQWTKLRPTSGGEACNRTGSTSCQSLCF
jgi:N-acetylneuraminic acid mutarotase